MRLRSPSRPTLAVAATALASCVLTLVAVTVLAAPSAVTATSVSGKGVGLTKVVRETGTTSTSSTSFVNVNGATTSITVPSSQQAIILARFTAGSNCTTTGGVATSCLIKILIGGVAGEPSGTANWDTALPAGSGSGGSIEGHAIDRSSSVLGPGTYEVKVQIAVSGANTFHSVGNWSLTVFRVKV